MLSFSDAIPSRHNIIDFSLPADEVAPMLLGAIVRRGSVAIRLTEVEAYMGEVDPASHAYIGPTERNNAMFQDPQCIYVYASYGIHRAGNLVCAPNGTASGVLMRAGEVVEGLDIARRRREAPRGKDKKIRPPEDVALARGPGNLGRALGLNLDLNRTPLFQPKTIEERDAMREEHRRRPPVDPAWDLEYLMRNLPLSVEAPAQWLEYDEGYVTGNRIGISKNVDAPYRYWIPSDKTVTTPRGRPKK